MANERKCPFCEQIYGTVLKEGETICPTCHAEVPDIKTETKDETKEETENGG